MMVKRVVERAVATGLIYLQACQEPSVMNESTASRRFKPETYFFCTHSDKKKNQIKLFGTVILLLFPLGLWQVVTANQLPQSNPPVPHLSHWLTASISANFINLLAALSPDFLKGSSSTFQTYIHSSASPPQQLTLY